MVGLRIRAALLFGLAATVSVVASTAGAEVLAPRLPGVKSSAAVLAAMPKVSTVTVKFKEGSGLRLRAQGFIGPSGAPESGLTSALTALGIDLAGVQRLHTAPEAALDSQRLTLQKETGEALADLNLYYVIRVPRGTTAAALADRLNRLPEVEFAEPSAVPAPLPAAVDIPPTTPNFTASQGYRKAAPIGVGVLNAKTTVGGDGAGITFVDVEYSWRLDHEDLGLPASTIFDTATAVDPFNDKNHGTAVLGEIVGRSNSYGVTGIAPKAKPLVAAANTANFGYRPERAIALATLRLKRGDVIVIEQQYWACGLTGNRYGPLEWLQSVFDATKTATAKGIIVVAAAGNGNINLDGANCLNKFKRATRDSGALLVGAGTNTVPHNRLSFSSYGSRLDVQGWGNAVMTTGYGDAFNPEERQRYTRQFSGTSSATPIVAGSVLAIQGVLKAKRQAPASTAELRRALAAVGTKQGDPANGRIGPLPNIKAMIAKILANRGLPATVGDLPRPGPGPV